MQFNDAPAPRPGPGVSNAAFSVRWTGYVQPRTSGLYTFYLQNIGSTSRLYINTNDSINNWRSSVNDELTMTKVLTAGVKYHILLEYWDNYGPSSLTLKWSGPSVLKQLIPTSSMFSMESALPVLFKEFTVRPRNEQLQLSWKVEDLGNVKGYAVERRRSGAANFETIAFINATAGNNYVFTDAAAQTNTLYEYRIRQVDLDGRATYSVIRMGRLSGAVDFDYVIVPNPAEVNRQVQLLFTQAIGQAEILLISPEGKTLQQRRVTAAGQNIELPLKGIPAGTYYIKVIQGRQVVVKKLLVQ